MPSAYWGAGQALSLTLPETWQGWLLLGSYLVLFIALLFSDRANMQKFSLRKWFGWLLLGVLALVASQLFPVTFAPLFLPLTPENGTVSVSLLAAVPGLLAGVLLGPGPALLVGMSAGLGHALGQTHQLYDLFHYAFAAWLAGSLLNMNYYGWLYRLLRNPPVAGTISQGAIALMGGFAAFVLSSEAGLLSRLDLALAEVLVDVFPLLVEGFAGGLIVVLILLVVPPWRTGKELIPTPGQRSVQNYLLTNLVLFGGAVLVIVAAATVVVTTYVSTRLIVAELAAQANAGTAQMAEFQAQMMNNLLAFSDEDGATKLDRRALSRLYRTTGYYEQVLVIDGDQNIADGYPEPKAEDALTDSELAAVVEALHDEMSRSLVVDSGEVTEPQLSVVVPLIGGEEGQSILIGRVKKSSLAKTMDSLAESGHPLSGAIVNLSGVPVAEVGAGSHPWPGTAESAARPVFVLNDFGGEALLGESETGARHLVYLAPSGSRPWRVAVSVPYEVVLKQALGVAIPIVLALVAVAGVFYARLANYSRTLSGSISDLTQTSKEIAGGATVVPSAGIARHDEVGELSRAMLDMQRGVKKRIDELSLLLTVSRESSTSFELADSLPVVIHGVFRATGASGVRGLVLNPAGSRPITFAEGPAANNMSVFDARLMSLVRHGDELALGAPQEIRERLEPDPAYEFGIKALYALPLEVEGKFLGVLAVGFRDRRTFTDSDIALLQSLARQASVLVQKSYLYTYAEGGRRRLAAVLASTSEAVIVTDQSSRIVVINGAMEEAFHIKTQQVVGLKVADVIDSKVLVGALSGEEGHKRDLEVVGKDGRTYFANTSTIVSHEKQTLGRVAVLHDVTNLKAVDRLKSEFIDNVSHDLRTPLTALSGYASMLSLMDDLSPEQRKYADKIMQSVERMIELVENLLDLGRIESGVDLVFEHVAIGPLLKDIADEHWLYAHDSGIRLHVRVADDLPLVRCDRQRVRQAIRNLLTNGFKYAPDSGDITLATQFSGDEVIISVRDRGPGIAKKEQRRLFEKFYRVKRHGAGEKKGSGLGLAIVRSIAEQHGGHAWCESEPGKGSTFYISLPINGVDDSLA